MAVVTSLVGLEKGLNTKFRMAYAAKEARWPKIAIRVPSDARDEHYGWFGSVAGMREWTDERVPRGFPEHDYRIKNRHWESSFEVDMDDVADNKIGGYAIKAAEVGVKAKRHPDSLIIGLLVDGQVELCYDGQAFFSAAHVDPGAEYTTAQSNMVSHECVDATAPTVAELTAALRAGRARMMTFKDGYGDDCNLGPSGLALVCGVDLMGGFEDVLTKTIIDNSTNTMKGAADLMVEQGYTPTTKFVLLKTDMPMKSLVFQERQELKTATTAHATQAGWLGGQVQGEAEFRQRKRSWGVDARYNAGYGDWRYAVEVTLTTAE